MKKVAVLQSNYIPWKGYFDLIASVDEFILYDEMQYTRRDWRNRNQVKTPSGPQWLTVPVRVKGKFHQTIRETELDGSDWQESHWKTLSLNYRNSPHFKTVGDYFEPIYRGTRHTHLSTLNRTLIEAVNAWLGITTKISSCSEYTMIEGKTERLVDLCAQAGGGEYVSGPAAKGYLQESQFAARGIRVSWFDYAGYPEYPQLWPPFVHGVTVLDLLFNCGKEAPEYMKYVR